jgi:hypothetical protein
LDEVAEVIFVVGEWPCEIIICFLYVLKCDFGLFDEAMFEGVERICEFFFCILGIQISGFDEFVEVTFLVGEWH